MMTSAPSHSTNSRGRFEYINELVIHEIRNNVSKFCFGSDRKRQNFNSEIFGNAFRNVAVLIGLIPENPKKHYIFFI